jgi:DNA-binding MarR family transcriptional regulator
MRTNSHLSPEGEHAPSIADVIRDKTERRRKAKSSERHVRLYFALLDSHAWSALSHTEQAAYIAFCRVYNGSNNGRLAMSVRDLQKRLSCGQGTASRALNRLVEVGLIRQAKAGIFTRREDTRRAAEWRLTDYKCDVSGEMPSREWRRWRP